MIRLSNFLADLVDVWLAWAAMQGRRTVTLEFYVAGLGQASKIMLACSWGERVKVVGSLKAEKSQASTPQPQSLAKDEGNIQPGNVPST